MGDSQRNQGLRGVCAKLARAHEHLHALDSAIESWTKAGAYGYRKQFDADTGWVTLVGEWVTPPPDYFSAMLGDYLNNLRGVLDHLIAAIVRHHGGTVDRQAFPLLLAEKDWSDKPDWSKLAGVPLQWRTVVQCLQPYRRRDDPKQHPLGVLAILNNADKHHSIHPLASSPREINVSGRYPTGRLTEQYFLPPFSRLETGTVLAGALINPPQDFDMKMDREMGIQIAFEHEGLSGVFGDLPQLFGAVQHVIDCLLPAFD